MQSLTVGRELKSIRQSRGLTLDELAEMTGVSKPMLGQIERGQSSPTINTLWKIATGLKAPLSSAARTRGRICNGEPFGYDLGGERVNACIRAVSV